VKFLFIALATEWGPREGGLSVFNFELMPEIANLLGSSGRCVCYVEMKSQEEFEQLRSHAAGHSIVLRYFHPEDLEMGQLTTRVLNDLNSGNLLGPTKPEDFQSVLILGHDVKTGHHAISFAQTLSSEFPCEVQPALVRHMAYVHYLHHSRPDDENVPRFEEQTNLTASFRHVFAVGPLLEAAVQSGIGAASSSPAVHCLIPGVPLIKVVPSHPRAMLFCFVGGRLGTEDDRIKNGRLSIKALAQAYRSNRVLPAGAQGRWATRGKLYMVGVSLNEIQRLTSEAAEASEGNFEVIPMAYTEDRPELFKLLSSCDLAFMPSWHEGFGMAGWEALAAGVPLICSRESGLYQFLEACWNANHKLPRDCVEPFLPSGQGYDGNVDVQDINRLSNAISTLSWRLPRAKSHAIEMSQYMQENFTWKHCAKNILSALGWSIDPSSSLVVSRHNVPASSTPLEHPKVSFKDSLSTPICHPLEALLVRQLTLCGELLRQVNINWSGNLQIFLAGSVAHRKALIKVRRLRAQIHTGLPSNKVDYAFVEDPLTICKAFAERNPIYKILEVIEQRTYPDYLARQLDARQRWIYAFPIINPDLASTSTKADPIGVISCAGTNVPFMPDDADRWRYHTHLERLAEIVGQLLLSGGFLDALQIEIGGRP
jgi:glycosyltransferase involved in cell wall biosynthesis